MKVACSEVKKGKLADVDVHAGRTTKLVYGNRSTSDVLRLRHRRRSYIAPYFAIRPPANNSSF
jgi:hypothetical protein